MYYTPIIILQESKLQKGLLNKVVIYKKIFVFLQIKKV